MGWVKRTKKGQLNLKNCVISPFFHLKNNKKCLIKVIKKKNKKYFFK